jgi:putative transposase
MKKARFTESQIISILTQQEKGISVTDICREQGISKATFFNWKGKYGGMTPSQLRRLKELEIENARLKKMYADLSLVHDAFKDAIEKKL